MVRIINRNMYFKVLLTTCFTVHVEYICMIKNLS